MKIKQKNNHKTTLNKQKGAVLVMEAIMAATIITIALASFYIFESKKKQDMLLHEAGNQIMQFNNAVRGYVAEHTYESTPPSDKTGVKWLKPTSCGGDSSVQFLPCSFPETTVIGQTFSTSFNKSSDVLTATTTISKPSTSIIKSLGYSDKYVWTIAEKVAFYARSGDANLGSPPVAVYWDIDANPGLNVNTASLSDSKFGIIEIKDKSVVAADAWLRTDGSNKMLADLDMDGNDIINVVNLSNNNNGVTIDDDLNVNKKLVVSGTTNLKDDVSLDKKLSVIGDTFLDGNASIGKISGGYLITTDTSNKKVSISDDLDVGGNVNISGNLDVSGDTNGVDYYGSNLTLTNNANLNTLIADSDMILNSVQVNGSPASMTKGLYDVRIINAASNGSSGVNVSKPTCPTGLTPTIFAALQNPINKDDSVQGYFYGSYVKITNSSSSWNLKAYYREDNAGDGNVVNKQFTNNELGAQTAIFMKCS